MLSTNQATKRKITAPRTVRANEENLSRDLKKRPVKHVDVSFHAAISQTLTEWYSLDDEKAFREL